MMFLLAVSDKIVLILYSEKWLAAIPFMQVLCLKGFFAVIGGTNTQAVKALGKSDILFKLELIKKPLFLGAIFAAMPFGPLAICIANTIYDFVGTVINALPNRKLLGYTLKEQLIDVMPCLLLSAAMLAAVMAIGIFVENIYLSLAIQMVAGAVMYLGLSHLLSLQSYEYVIANFKNYLNAKKGN